jgi:GAF domain-containing protein
MTGRVALEGRAIQIPDVLADPEYRATEYQQIFGYRTNLGVPLLRDGSTIGIFSLTRREVKPFTEEQIELVATFADQAVIAIENARLFDEVQARSREVQESLEYQTAISDVLNVISRSPNALQPVFDTIVQTAARLCEADYSVFFRLHEGKCYIGASNAEDDFIAFARENPFVPTRASCSGRALLEQRTVHVLDASTDPEYAMPDYQHVANNRTMLGVPLIRDGVSLGSITLWKTRVEPFTEKQIELITTFADQAIIAIENARLLNDCVSAPTTSASGQLTLAKRWTSRRLPLKCFRSSIALPAIFSQCSKLCWRMPSASVTPSLEISIAGTASFCTFSLRTIRQPPSPKFARVHRFDLRLSVGCWRRKPPPTLSMLRQTRTTLNDVLRVLWRPSNSEV